MSEESKSKKFRPSVVSADEWLQKRKELLEKEKELTRMQDEVTRLRSSMPWTVVTKEYSFEGTNGTMSLSDLFGSNKQLIICHFMFGPEWEAGCSSCSYMNDHMNGAVPHLNARDVTYMCVSRTSLEKIKAFKERMGWQFDWVSSLGSEFNFDFGVSFTPEAKETGKIQYNYKQSNYFSEEAPGASVFYKGDDGKIYHTYSVFGRGLERFITTYQALDMVPDGRNETGLHYTMAWVKHHDKYEC